LVKILLLVAACCINAARLPGVAHSTQFVPLGESALALDWEHPDDIAAKPMPSAAIIEKLFPQYFMSTRRM